MSADVEIVRHRRWRALGVAWALCFAVNAFGYDAKFIPLPVYATLPNEGSTFGAMPVVILVDPRNERTHDIFAPSISYNDTIGVTGTLRWFGYPENHQSWTAVLSGSTKVNWGGRLEWANETKEVGHWTDYALFRFGSNVFYRFFGIGPETLPSAETSHTRVMANVSYRRGFNFFEHFNAGFRLQFIRNSVEAITVPGLPFSGAVFPGAPGMGGGTVLMEQLDLIYDTRKDRDYSAEGWYAGLTMGPVQGLAASDNYWDMGFEAKALFGEFSFLQGGARFYCHYVSSRNVPFYYQSSLGGSNLLRGFTENRFIDQGAWTLELEQRLRIFQTRIYGVTTDWRADPFIAIGQVFNGDSGLFSDVRLATGIGLRAFVRPNVLGRLDIAWAGEGASFYVELGYPF
jgi:outer membrane protein assembly factor BamA